MTNDPKMDVDQNKESKDMKLSDSEKNDDVKMNSPTKDSKEKSDKNSSTAKKEKSDKDSDKKSEDSSSSEGKEGSEMEFEDKRKGGSETNVKEKSENNSSTLDREKVCPFLLRVFCKRGSHHRIDDFTINYQPVEDEIQIYTWKDASLREIASLLAEVDPKYAKHGNSISFKAIYLDNVRARYNSKDLGVINISKPSKTDDVTLADNGFIIGDFIDVALQSYSDVRRRYDRQDSFNSSRLGSGPGRFGGNGLRSFDRNRKGKIGERHDRFSRNMRDDRRRGSFRG